MVASTPPTRFAGSSGFRTSPIGVAPVRDLGDDDRRASELVQNAKTADAEPPRRRLVALELLEVADSTCSVRLDRLEHVPRVSCGKPRKITLRGGLELE
jgi:hypothetical protein